ncbi:HET domain-containing protein [Microdochium nivale]|nr:HET domain-containing protein [Microdochium nivale]
MASFMEGATLPLVKLSKTVLPGEETRRYFINSPWTCSTCFNLHPFSLVESHPCDAIIAVKARNDLVLHPDQNSALLSPVTSNGSTALVKDFHAIDFECRLQDIKKSASSKPACAGCTLLYGVLGHLFGDEAFLEPRLGVAIDDLSPGFTLNFQLKLMDPPDEEYQNPLGDQLADSGDDPQELRRLSARFGSLPDQKLFEHFELYTLQDQPCPWITVGSGVMIHNDIFIGSPLRGIADHVHHDPTTDKFWEFINRQLRVCTQEHDKCRACDAEAERDKLLPTRLLKIDTHTGAQPSLRLIDTRDEPGLRGERYVALSHRWVPNMAITTTTETLEARKHDIPWAALSPTFRDAATVALRIGVHLIWVDSLCIIQGNAEDWEIEASKMASTYRCAYAVVSATAANDLNDDGFLNVKPSYTAVHGTTIADEPFEMYLRTARRHHDAFEGRLRDTTPKNYALFSRAWCFQERLLATRVIHFVKDDIVFECVHGAVCQCGGVGELRESTSKLYRLRLKLALHGSIQFTYGPHYKKSEYLTCPTCGGGAVSLGRAAQTEHASGCSSMVYNAWYKIVVDYSKTSITFASDWLPALSGIAKQLSEQVDSRYFAGLWGGDILDGLLWIFSNNHMTDGLQPDGQGKPYLAPSWSWASAQAEVSYHLLAQKASGAPRYYLEFDVDRSDCILASRHNIFGAVTAGWLRLKGPAMPARLSSLFGTGVSLIRARLQVDHIPGSSEDAFLTCIADDPAALQARDGHRVWLVPVVQLDTRDDRSYALVLAEPLPATATAGQDYLGHLPEAVRSHHTILQRVGLMERYCHTNLQHEKYTAELDFYLV